MDCYNHYVPPTLPLQSGGKTYSTTAYTPIKYSHITNNRTPIRLKLSGQQQQHLSLYRQGQKSQRSSSKTTNKISKQSRKGSTVAQDKSKSVINGKPKYQISTNIKSTFNKKSSKNKQKRKQSQKQVASINYSIITPAAI